MRETSSEINKYKKSMESLGYIKTPSFWNRWPILGAFVRCIENEICC